MIHFLWRIRSLFIIYNLLSIIEVSLYFLFVIADVTFLREVSGVIEKWFCLEIRGSKRGGGGLTEIKIFALKSEETRKRENIIKIHIFFILENENLDFFC